MLRSYWGFIGAAFGWLVLSAASPPPAKPTERKQSNSELLTRAQFERAVIALEAQMSVAKDAGCEPGEDNRQSDLCAQWKAADSAYGSMLAAIVGLLIGSATLIFAWRAAHWAKQAATHTETGSIEAKRSANAAEESLAETRKAYAAQLRPYIFLAPTDESDKGEIFTLERIRTHPARMKLVNCGQTPGRNVAIAYGICFVNRPIGNVSPEIDEAHDVGSVGPGANVPISCDMSDTTDEELAALERGETALLFRCRVTYEFGENETDVYEAEMFVVKEHLGKRYTGHLLSQHHRKQI